MHTASRGAFVLYGCLIFTLVIMTMPATIFAATLSFSPATLSFPTGQEFSVKVTLDPGSDSVNASDGTISFDTSVLSVSSVSKDGSAFSLWTADPTYSNSAGTISFSGGTPSSFSKVSNILTITFKGKKVGTGQVSFSKGSVLAADGKGTDVYAGGATTTITITDAVAAPPPPADTSSADDFSPGPTPLAPTVTSPTHSKPDSWYATSTGIFDWKLQPDVTGVRTLLSTQSDATPTQVQSGTSTTQTVTGIPDGVSYFFVQFKNDSGWGPSGNLKLQVDTVPPNEFDVALIPAKNPDPAKFSFAVTDDLSGVDHFDILIAGNVLASPKAAELVNNTYPVPPQDGGPQTVVIKAYDKAGNVREVSKQFTLPKVAKPVAASDAPPPTTGNSLWQSVLLVIFALALGGLFVQGHFNRKNYAAEKAKFLKRVNEAGDKNDRVFSAMREEFEQMINDLDEKPQLTVAERDFLENMKEVLDVSEELIGSGTEELKKMIRGT